MGASVSSYCKAQMKHELIRQGGDGFRAVYCAASSKIEFAFDTVIGPGGFDKMTAARNWVASSRGLKPQSSTEDTCIKRICTRQCAGAGSSHDKVSGSEKDACLHLISESI